MVPQEVSLYNELCLFCVYGPCHPSKIPKLGKIDKKPAQGKLPK